MNKEINSIGLTVENGNFMQIPNSVLNTSWFFKPNYYKTFFYLVSHACYVETKELNKGDLIISYRSLAKELNINKDFLFKIINFFIKENIISKRSSCDNTIISVLYLQKSSTVNNTIKSSISNENMPKQAMYEQKENVIHQNEKSNTESNTVSNTVSCSESKVEPDFEEFNIKKVIHQKGNVIHNDEKHNTDYKYRLNTDNILNTTSGQATCIDKSFIETKKTKEIQMKTKPIVEKKKSFNDELLDIWKEEYLKVRNDKYYVTSGKDAAGCIKIVNNILKPKYPTFNTEEIFVAFKIFVHKVLLIEDPFIVANSNPAFVYSQINRINQLLKNNRSKEDEKRLNHSSCGMNSYADSEYTTIL